MKPKQKERHSGLFYYRNLIYDIVIRLYAVNGSVVLRYQITSSNCYCSTLNNIACTTGSTQVGFGATREARDTRGKGKEKQ